MPLWNRINVIRIVLIATVTCFVYSVASTSVLWIEPTDIGLVNRLPFIFYAGLALLGCLWFLSLKYKSYLPVSLALTVAYLYVAPALIRVPVWISNSYYPYGESVLIRTTGHLVNNPGELLVSYRFWPMYLYFSSALKILTGMPDDILLKFFPLFTVSMYGFLTTLVLRVRLSLSHAIMGASLLMAGLFIRQQYFGPQAIAFFYFLSIILLMSFLFFDKKGNKKTTLLLILMFFVFATATHPLTSFLLLMAFVALFFTNRFVGFLNKEKTASVGELPIAVVAIIIWLIYNVSLAPSFFNTGIRHFIEIAVGLRDLNLYSEGSRIVGSTAMQISLDTQWAIVIIVGAVALLSIFQLLRRIKQRKSGLNYWIFNASLLMLLALFAFFGEYGYIESYLRAFMFALLPLSFLCVSLLKRKPVLIVILIVVLISLNVPAQYASDSFRSATQIQLAGTAFLAKYTPEDIGVVGKLCYIYMKYSDPVKIFEIVNIGLSPPFTDLPNSTVLNEALTKADYVTLSNLQSNYYLFYLGIDPMEQVDLEDYNRLYDNGGFNVLKASGV